MSTEHSLSYSIFSGLAAILGAIASSAVLVVVELMAALFLYFYLATTDREFFGELVGYAKTVLDFAVDQLQVWVPSFTNAANATLVGELAPKSMLLLLIGLIVGAVIRFTFWALAKLIYILKS
ncbi:MAG: hypothetical protein AAGG72_01110 [Pseudomonadota bacterium]